MFPIPSQLPKPGAEHISSQAEAEINAQDNQPVLETQSEQAQSRVLNLLEPLLRPSVNDSDTRDKESKGRTSGWNASEIKKVKENLQSAIEKNKVCSSLFSKLKSTGQLEHTYSDDDGRLKRTKFL